MDSPVLARLCGTGAVPPVTGVGGQMLVVFRSSEFDAPFNPTVLGSVPGFQLPVGISSVFRSILVFFEKPNEKEKKKEVQRAPRFSVSLVFFFFAKFVRCTNQVFGNR